MSTARICVKNISNQLSLTIKMVKPIKMKIQETDAILGQNFKISLLR